MSDHVIIFELAGVGLGLLGIAAPAWIDEMPKWSKYLITAAGFAALIWSAVLAIEDATGMKMGPVPFALIIFGVCSAAAGVFLHIYMPQTAPSPPFHAPAQPHQEPTKPVKAPPIITTRPSTTLSEQERTRRAALLSRLRTKYPDRIPADATPDYLMDFYKDQMNILAGRAVAPFIGKWFIFSGHIDDVQEIGAQARIGYYIQVMLVPPRHVLMYFGSTWADRVSVLLPRQEISAFCRLDRVNATQVIFDPCELIDAD